MSTPPTVTLQKFAGDMEELRRLVIKNDFIYFNGDLYHWEDGVFVPVEDHQIENGIERIAKEIFGYNTIGKNIKGEIIDSIKSKNFMKSEEVEKRSNPSFIAFNNGYIDIEELKKGIIALHDFDINIKNNLFFQRVPHNINIDLLGTINQTITPDSETILKAFAPNIYKFFNELVGEKNVKVQIAKIGYCFYRSNPYKLAFMEIGEGDSGKTTYLKYLQTIIGAKNITGESLQSLSNYPFAREGLQHKLLNACDDLNAREMVKDTGTFKMLTGNSRITAQRKHKGAISFEIYAKLLFTANNLPPIHEDMLDDMAFFKRWLLTRYTNKFARNDEFQTTLLNNESEIETVIISALYSLKEFLNQGPSYIGDIGSDNMETWKRQTNNVYDFIKSTVEKGTLKLDNSLEAKMSKDMLYHDFYQTWMESYGHGESVTKTKFTQILGKLFNISTCQIKDGTTTREGYKGVRAASPGEEGYVEVQDFGE